jgi:hypothetical protein
MILVFPSNGDVRKSINSAHFVNIRYKKVKKSEVNSTIIKKIEEMLKR